MMEYLYLLCLLALTVSVPILIRGCFNIHKELPNQGGQITEQISGIHGLLDELNDLISEVTDGFAQSTSGSPQSPPDFLGLLSAFLNRNNEPNLGHGKEPQEWEILPPEDPQTKQTEDELNQPSS